MEDDLRRVIARLAVAVMAADGRIAPEELEALRRLDGLGLGPLSRFVGEELERAIQEPIDLRAACDALPSLDFETASLVLVVLAEVATGDRHLSLREVEAFEAVAAHLGIGRIQAGRILEAAMGASGPATASTGSDDAIRFRKASPAANAGPEKAYRTLGLEVGAGPEQVDAAYLGLVDVYNPTKVIHLGAEFAALAVHRLAAVTAAFETVRAWLESADPEMQRRDDDAHT